jgi:3-methyladenine DNA glycosylase AlkD
VGSTSRRDGPTSRRDRGVRLQADHQSVRKALRAQADPVRAKNVARFFKTGPGDYGEGDRFIGVTVPAQRIIARTFRDLTLAEVDLLLTSPIHEERLTALLILVDQFERASRVDGETATTRRRRIFRLYLKRLRFINNWDLVDTSASPIVGGWLAAHPDAGLLSRLARSTHLWSRRVAMIATFHGIARGDHRDAIRIARILVQDREDLMHKAVGWMLREVGKRASLPALERFLAQHAATMPRTMLRYAIERLPASERQRWMALKNRES